MKRLSELLVGMFLREVDAGACIPPEDQRVCCGNRRRLGCFGDCRGTAC